MKRLGLLLLTITMILGLASCAASPASVAPTVEATVEPTAKPTAAPTAEPTAKPTAAPTAEVAALPAGLAVFESTKDGISFQHPDAWFVASADTLNTLDKDVLGGMLSEMNLTQEQFAEMLKQVTVVLYDLENSDADFSSNLNLVAASTPGITSDMLTNEDDIASLADSLAQQYKSVFTGFSWLKEPAAQTFGTVEGIYFVSSYDLSGTKIAAAQAYVAGKDTLYIFTYTTTAAAYGDSTDKLISNIMASIEFK